MRNLRGGSSARHFANSSVRQSNLNCFRTHGTLSQRVETNSLLARAKAVKAGGSKSVGQCFSWTVPGPFSVLHPRSRTINIGFSVVHYSDERPVAVLYVYVICAKACANCVASAGVIAAGNFSNPAPARLLIIVAMPEL